MIGREGPGPERPGPDYPPEWDDEHRAPRPPSCRSPYGCLAEGEGCSTPCPITDDEARELEMAARAIVVPDPWMDPDAAARAEPPPF